MSTPKTVPGARATRTPITRAVEVLCDRGEDHPEPQERWLAGSGYLVGGRRVVTAAHCVDWGEAGTVSIRTVDGAEHASAVRLSAARDDPADVAVLHVDDPAFDEDVPPVGLARIDRGDPRPVTGCWAVGFPGFQENRVIWSDQPTRRALMRRQTAQVWGFVLPGTFAGDGGRMELTTTTEPRDVGRNRSAWEGMSGAALLVIDESGESRLLGVVTLHDVPAGAAMLTVTPVADLLGRADDAGWRTELDLADGGPSLVGRDELPALSGLFRGPVAEGTVQAAAWVEQQHGPRADGESGVDATTVRRSLSDELRRRSAELLAVPADEEPPGGPLQPVVRSPQMAMIIDQLVAGYLFEDRSADIGALLRPAFVNLCAVHGIPVDDGAFDSLTETCRHALRGLHTDDRLVEGYWQRRVRYSDDTLSAQLAALDDYVAARPTPKSVVDFLDRLREHVRNANSRISLALLGQNKAHPIDDLYVEPHVVPSERPVQSGGARDWPENAFEIRADDSPTLSDLVGRRTIVLGQPGVGKSTLTTKLAFSGSAPDLVRTPVPIVVTLRKLMSERDREPMGILDYIVELCRLDMAMSDASESLLRYLLIGGELHVIFDGLDEVTDPNNYHWVTQAIDSFCLEYKAARITLTSREHGFDRGRFPDFAVHALRPFDRAQVSDYVHRWFALDESLSPAEQARSAKDFLAQGSATDELRGIPLMLALMCSIYAVEGNIPSRLSEIYETCSTLYFRDWDVRRRIRISDTISDLRPEIMFEAFSSLAATILSDPVLSGSGITEQGLLRLLREFFARKKVLREGEEVHVATEFSRFVTGRAWLLERSGRNENADVLFQFTHRTFLEYFAAAHYSRTMVEPSLFAERLLGTLVADRQPVVAELAFQIHARHRPHEIDPAARHLVESASLMSVGYRTDVARFAVTLIDVIPFERDTVRLLAAFVIGHLCDLGEVGLSVWGANGYHDHDESDWFTYRSLAQSAGFGAVDEPSEILAGLLMSTPLSRGVLVDAVRDALRAESPARPRVAALLVSALAEVLMAGYGGEPLTRESEQVARWVAVTKEMWSASSEQFVAEATRDPSLACCATKSGVLMIDELIGMHGAGVLYRPPLNVFCESDWTLAQILVTNCITARPGSGEETELPTEGDRRALHQFFDLVERQPDVCATTTVCRPRDALTFPPAPVEESPNPRMRASDEVGAVLLIMVDSMFRGQGESPRDTASGPHLAGYRDFLNGWWTVDLDEPTVREALENQAPARHVDVLLDQARRLRTVDPDALAPPDHTTRTPTGDLVTRLRQPGRSPDGDPVVLGRRHVELLRRLMVFAPGGHRAELLRALGALCDELRARDDLRGASDIARERVAVARAASSRPDEQGGVDELLAALAPLAELLARTGEPDAAVDGGMEMLGMAGHPRSQDPTVPVQTIVDALVEAGEGEQADRLAAERIAALVRAEDRPDAVKDAAFRTARAVDDRTLLLSRTGRFPEAVVSAEDALRRFRALDPGDGVWYGRNVRLMLGRLTDQLAEVGEQTRRVAVLRERLALEQEAETSDPDRASAVYAARLLVRALSETGADPEAVVVAREAVVAARRDTAEPPAREELAGALGDLARMMTRTGETAEAAKLGDEQLGLLRDLIGSGDADPLDLAWALFEQSNRLMRIRRRREGFALITELTDVRMTNGMTTLGPPKYRDR